jgi:hypothetical protein
MFSQIAVALVLATLPPSLPDLAGPVTPVDYILPAQRVVAYGPLAEVRVLTDIRLPVEAQTAYDLDFASASYFGAYAVSKDGGWGLSTGNNALDAAREMAMQECLSVNAACTIHSELVPAGYVDIGPGDVTVTPEAAGHYTDVSTNIPFFAMAVSADGAYSKVWGYATQAEADRQALSDCEGYRVIEAGLSDMPCILLPRAGKK